MAAEIAPLRTAGLEKQYLIPITAGWCDKLLVLVLRHSNGQYDCREKDVAV